MLTIPCPVCKRPEVKGNICPNCETNLSTLRMLVELPTINSTATPQSTVKPTIPLWLLISVAITFLLFGTGLGITGNSFWNNQELSLSNSSITNTLATLPINPLLSDSQVKYKNRSCNGFNYTVRRGDSLSKIAENFYGNAKLWSLITERNSFLKNRENLLEIGEKLCIPNKEDRINETL